MQRRYTAFVLVLIAMWIAGNAQAEVRAIMNRNGDYHHTRILLQETQTFGVGGENVWTPVGWNRNPLTTLNRNGDMFGDLWPAIGEPGSGPSHSWVVWSRYSDEWDYDLVWTRWKAGRWETVQWVEPDTADAGPDLDPDITFDRDGRPHIVWWRPDAEGTGRVFLSIFLVNQWMQAFPVSDGVIDCRYPSIEIGPWEMIRVKYNTPDGPVVHYLSFNAPDTITDDIDPLDYMESEETHYEFDQRD